MTRTDERGFVMSNNKHLYKHHWNDCDIIHCCKKVILEKGVGL